MPHRLAATIRRAGPGLSRAPTHRAYGTTTLLSTAWCSRWEVDSSLVYPSAGAELYDPRAGPGPARAATPRAAQRRCCPTVWSGCGGLDTNLGVSASAELYVGDRDLDDHQQLNTALQPRNVAGRRRRARCGRSRPRRFCERGAVRPAAGPGLPRAASTSDVRTTRRLCCPTAWSLLQEGLIAGARNYTTQRAGAGLPRAVSTPDASCTPRPCCLTARCLLRLDTIATMAVLSPARNCTILQQPDPHG